MKCARQDSRPPPGHRSEPCRTAWATSRWGSPDGPVTGFLGSGEMLLEVRAVAAASRLTGVACTSCWGVPTASRFRSVGSFTQVTTFSRRSLSGLFSNPALESWAMHSAPHQTASRVDNQPAMSRMALRGSADDKASIACQLEKPRAKPGMSPGSIRRPSASWAGVEGSRQGKKLIWGSRQSDSPGGFAFHRKENRLVQVSQKRGGAECAAFPNRPVPSFPKCFLKPAWACPPAGWIPSCPGPVAP